MIVGDRLTAALIAIAGLGAYGTCHRWLAAVSAFPVGADASRLDLSEQGASSSDFAVRARRALALAPLDQRKLNAWYVHQVATGAPKAQQMASMTQLERMGWRDSAAQFNLIYSHALTGDLAGLLPRVDALLRRSVATEKTLQILWMIEATGQFRPAIRTILAQAPAWRSVFLRSRTGLQTPAQVHARAMTINDLLARRLPVARGELVPVLNRLVAQGETARAYDLWRRSQYRPITEGLSDPHFARAAQIEAMGDAVERLPFEWGGDSGPELAVNFDARAESATGDVEIRWSGLGTPVFLRQTFRARPGRYVLRITGSDAKPALLSKLILSVRCPGATVQFARPVPDKDAASALVLAGDAPITCSYPTFTAAANIDDVQGRFDLNLSGFELQRQ